MRKRAAAMFTASMVVVLAAVTTAWAAPGAPAPKTYQGAKVALYASGGLNLTSFAWLNGAMFAGDSGDQPGDGGLDLVKNHVVTRIPSSLAFVGGLAVHKHVLYISAGSLGNSGPVFQILAWSGWNGTTFTHQRVVYTAPQGFQGFNGLAFGANGRLYVGADVGLLNRNDHGPASTSPYLYDILSMNTSGKNVKVFAKGIRQAWQLAFAPGSSSPFAGDLGQDCKGANPCSPTAPPANVPDFLLKIKQGQNYGFPTCTHAKPSNCKGYAKPFKTLPAHWDPMGLAIIGKTMYVGSFLGPKGQGGALYSMPLTGGKLRLVVNGFPAATDALAAHSGALFVGGSTQAGTGVVYKVTLKKAVRKAQHKKKGTSPTFTG